MANQADKIRSINSVGWDGVNATETVHPIRHDLDQQMSLDVAFRKTFQTKEKMRIY